MKLGVKIAPGRAWQHTIEATQPAMVEIWYNASRPNDYTDMFSYLKDKPIDVGLHFWGAVNGFLANTSYPDKTISKPSLALMYETIDVASRNTCCYVNIHPDLYALLGISDSLLDIRVASEQAEHALMDRTFMDNAEKLSKYAKARNVVLTVETVPSRDTPSWRANRDRTQVINIHQMPIDVIVSLAKRGVAVANDFGHTASTLISDHRSAVWRHLNNITKTLVPHTRLIHLGFIVPPYNGVDFHYSLDNPLLSSPSAVPNEKEMKDLLSLFQNRDDVWILVEPPTDHIKNYVLAKKIIQKI